MIKSYYQKSEEVALCNSFLNLRQYKLGVDP